MFLLSTVGSLPMHKDKISVVIPGSVQTSCFVVHMLFKPSLGWFYAFSCFLPSQGLLPSDDFKPIDNVPSGCVSYQYLVENSEDV